MTSKKQRLILDVFSKYHNSLGVVLGKQGRFVDAENSHRKALELNKANPEYYLSFGVIL